MAKRRWGIIVVFFAATAVFVLIWGVMTPVQGLVEKSLTLISGMFLLVIPGFFWRPAWLIPLLALPVAKFLAATPPPWWDIGMSEPFQTALRSYQGVPYVWGGENGRGIDCSGLIRRAWMDALIEEGRRTGSSRYFREAADIWWRDCTATELGEGYGGRTFLVSHEKSLNLCNYRRLKLGDMAVTENGVHVLAYVGNKTWIQADPNLANGGDKVILTKAPCGSGWFHMRVKICRWSMLQGSG